MKPKPRNGGKWTEAKFWGFIRSQLRHASIKWAPRAAALKASRRPTQNPGRGRKWDYRCAQCGQWCLGSNVQVDHITEAGTLRCAEDLPGFVERLFCEADGFQVLCKECHKNKTHK